MSNIFEKIKYERNGVANVHQAFSSFEIGVEAHYEFYKKIILADDLPLSRAEREVLAVETSRLNQCPYCIHHHQSALEKVIETEKIGHSKLNVLKSLATELTQTPWKSSCLKKTFFKVGFGEEEWLHALMIVSYFNFVNRCVHGAGVELEDEFLHLCN
ncbi:carboxymuconolactone decarboxylase family protein [Halobacteriovorax sp.]|uniref:carboxymuconolactone decarboxylase family protein n=1 Tax=Halobacteriovorax sp. TaxID=2020862 RepID=UPI003AF2916C